jgi:hypothetical protein
MKNYLFQQNKFFFHSLTLFLFINLSSSCILKKKKKEKQVTIEQVSTTTNAKVDTISPITSAEPMIEEELQDMGALPPPKMINQKYLDSIKAEKMKEKRKK